MKTAIYLRVSSKDGTQDTVNQRLQLIRYAEEHNFDIYKIYEDRKSGKNDNRVAFQKMFADAAEGKFQLVLFWALDRFSREGIYRTFQHIHRLNQLGIAFHSYQQPYLRTTDKMVGEILLSIWAAMAEQERLLISERTKAGLAAVVAKSKPGPQGFIGPGRRFKPVDVEAAKRLQDKGYSLRAIAEILGKSVPGGISPALIHARLKMPNPPTARIR